MHYPQVVCNVSLLILYLLVCLSNEALIYSPLSREFFHKLFSRYHTFVNQELRCAAMATVEPSILEA